MVLAANTLVQSNTKVALICIATAIGQTALVMASYLYGERDRDGIIKVFRAAVSVSFGPCLILSVVLFVFAEPIVSLFTSNQELILLATNALRIFIIGFPIIGVKMFYINFFQASRNSAMSCLSSIVGELVYITVTSFLFVQWFGIIGLWAAYPASELLYLITVFIAACIRYRHIPRTIDEILFLDPGFDVPPERMLSINIRSREQVGTIHNKVMTFCTEQGLSTRMATAFSFASEEMVSEIFDYAYAEGKKRQLKYCMKVKDDEIVIFTRDEFESFDLTEEGKVPKDDFLADIGIHLMFKLADDVMYIAVFNLNNLVIRIDRHKLPATAVHCQLSVRAGPQSPSAR